MRLARSLAPLALVGTAIACGSVPNDPGARILTPTGIIRGTFVYSGPRPCSSNGHIVGNGIVFVFDRRNPPPPNGLANLPANFIAVTGDRLFGDEPRYTGSDVYCPADNGFTETITASAPFEVSPIPGGSYELQAFYDYTGDFLPTFKFRQLPEKGDIGGGVIDTADALKPSNASNPNYQAHFLPVEVGISQNDAPPGFIPNYTIPSSGYVADNVTITVGQTLPITRPYFYPQGVTLTLSGDKHSITTDVAQSSDQAAMNTTGISGTVEQDPNYAPILTIPQDLKTLAAPPKLIPDNGSDPFAGPVIFEQQLPHIRLQFGVPANEVPNAAAAPRGAPNSGQSFHFGFQIEPNPAAEGYFLVWQNQAPLDGGWAPQYIPEGRIPQFWPLVVLAKLEDDPDHSKDPASLQAQGSATAPVVIMQGITIPANGDPTKENLLTTAEVPQGLGPAGLKYIDSSNQPVVFTQDHLTVALRPSVICFNSLFDATNPDKRGTLVTPYSSNDSADYPKPYTDTSIVPEDLLHIDPTSGRATVSNLVKDVAYGCLPTGRYAINVVYPDGQAWTVPNEAGACSGTEGSTDWGNLTCTIKPRPVLHSQGPRAIVEVVAATDPNNCKNPGPPPGDVNKDAAPASAPAPAVPSFCMPMQQ